MGSQINKVIKEFIKKEARDEAKEILRRSVMCDIRDFLRACANNNGNVACLILDNIKDKLVKQNKMKNEGFFGTKKSYEKI